MVEPVVLIKFVITLFTDIIEIRGLRKRTTVTVKELRSAKWREVWLTIFIVVELLVNIFER